MVWWRFEKRFRRKLQRTWKKATVCEVSQSLLELCASRTTNNANSIFDFKSTGYGP